MPVFCNELGNEIEFECECDVITFYNENGEQITFGTGDDCCGPGFKKYVLENAAGQVYSFIDNFDFNFDCEIDECGPGVGLNGETFFCGPGPSLQDMTFYGVE